MLRRAFSLLALFLSFTILQAADPLRIHIRGGAKSHGPGAHEHEQFLKLWTKLLTERGASVTGSMDFPTDTQLDGADVLIMYAQEGGNIPDDRKPALDKFLKRGGGITVIHTASVSKDHAHWKSVIGGSWVHGQTKWREGDMDLYYVDRRHPITKDASNYRMNDEIYYDMDISPDVRVLAAAYTPNVRSGKKSANGQPHIYDIQPQIWTYEKDNYRAFVHIPGHLLVNFTKPHFRAVLLRGIAWSGKRANVDELCSKEELDSLLYPDGGPRLPENTLANLEIHPDFNLTLVANEPLINKPMNIDWDPSGRLWVAETPEYPNGRRGMRPDYRGKEWKDAGGIDPTPGDQQRPAIDKISILTDTNGDGVMDKKHVFHEGLDLVTGLVFHQDGVIVTQAPDILFLRDTNGDGTCDKVVKLYTGLGTGDTHAVINNPRWGWDGWIYATHGYSGSGKVTNGDGSVNFGGCGSGVVRFKPDGSAFEQYSSKGGNTWGLQITADNRVMWTQPTSGELLMHTILPEYALARGKIGNHPSYKVVQRSGPTFPLIKWEQLAYVQIDWVGSFTAAAGTTIYDGGSWPAEYNGDYFTTEPTINIIHHSRLKPVASSFEAARLPGREETEFIRSKDMWWRPIDVRVGPDGAVYVCDFYNQAVIHNDTRGPDHNRVNAAVRPDRDHYFGRIWRLDHKQAKATPVPDLAKASAADLAKALAHPNSHVRHNAFRLLSEKGVDAALLQPVSTGSSPEARIAALWTRAGTRQLDAAAIEAAAKDPDANVRRNAALAAEANGGAVLPALINDAEAPVRLAALRAAAPAMTAEAARAIVAAWPKFDDDYQRSAAAGALVPHGAAAIAAALESKDPESLAPLMKLLVGKMAAGGDAAGAGQLVVEIAGKPATVDPVKKEILDALNQGLAKGPELSPALSKALISLLASPNPAVRGAALPLASKWDRAGALKPELDKLGATLLATLKDATKSDDERGEAAGSLLGMRAANPGILDTVAGILGANASPALQQRVVKALADTGEDRVGALMTGTFATLSPAAQSSAFEAMLPRPAWTRAFLDAAKERKVDLAAIGPANAFRLRTHPDKAVADHAVAVLEALKGPEARKREELIASLVHEVEKPGDPVKGKVLYTAACAICHKLGNEGKDVGPALTGMGAHGPGELVVHIVDPNREVDPTFLAWNIETKDGKFHTGVIVRENSATVLLRNQGGDEEISKADIKTRVNTGRSLMPEGLEALQAEGLRDILAFLCGADAGKFRMLDLRDAFTATTARGLYGDDGPTKSLDIRKHGVVNFEGIPFNVIAPERAPNGRNAINLKGGMDGTFGKTRMPVKATVKGGGFKANRLHFLGGIGGWAHPYNQEEFPVMNVTVRFADGDSQVITLKNGVEIADHIARNDVPGSKFAPGVSEGFQVRWFSKGLKKAGEIASIELESLDTTVTPTTLAITAELAGPDAKPLPPEPAAAAEKALEWGPGLKVLLVGGGSSHDFQKYFNLADTAILNKAGITSVHYTESSAVTARELKNADVLLMSTNQGGFPTPAFKETLNAHVDAGKGVVLLHPAVWYNWGSWPDYNARMVAGGSRGHDKIREFAVTAKGAAHPILKGVPATFRITDELYYVNLVPDAKVDVLVETEVAEGTKKSHPSVWTVSHPKARIACIALGHDGRAHDLPAFQSLLVNAVNWAGGK